MRPAIWLRAYRRPDFIEDCATTDQITAIQRNYFCQIGVLDKLILQEAARGNF
jgi:hypothetical protein